MSYIKALDVFFITSFFFVFGAVLEYVIVRLHSEKNLTKWNKEDKIDIEMSPKQKVSLKKIFPILRGENTKTLCNNFL